MTELKTPQEIDKMAVTGRFVAQTLATLGARAQPGVNLLDLEHPRARARRRTRCAIVLLGLRALLRRRTVPQRDLPVGERRRPARQTTQPRPRRRRRAHPRLRRLHRRLGRRRRDHRHRRSGGPEREANQRLIDSTRRALAAGIAAAVPGGHLGDVSAVIGAVAIDDGYTVNTQFGGHGLGRTMHEDPHIPNLGERGTGLAGLRAGMTLAIGIRWARGTNRLTIDPDGWTLRSADGSMTAHTEHTIAGH